MPSEAELLVKMTQENQTRKILAVAQESKDKEEIIKNIKRMLEE